MTTAQRMILGFIAAAISVLIFHQGMILLLREIGMLPAAARVWNLAPTPYGVPQVLNLCFWGGLYGVAFGLLAHLGVQRTIHKLDCLDALNVKE